MITLKLAFLLLAFCLFVRYTTKNKQKITKSYNIFYSTDKFPILKFFENSWISIYNEAINLPKNINSMPNFNRINEKIIEYTLMENDYLMGRNAQLCPVTSTLLSRFPGIIHASIMVLNPFSISSVSKKYGNQKSHISYCLGLQIPEDGFIKLYSMNNSMNITSRKAFLYDSSYPFYFENQSNYMEASILCIDIKFNN